MTTVTTSTKTTTTKNNSVLLNNNKTNRLQKQPLSPPKQVLPQKMPKVKENDKQLSKNNISSIQKHNHV